MPTRGIPEEFEVIEIPSNGSASFEIRRNIIGFEIYEPTGIHTIRWDMNEVPSDANGHTVPPNQRGGLSQIFNPKDATIYVTSETNAPVNVEIRKLLGGSI